MAATEKDSVMNVGRIIRVVGPVIDVEFPPDTMPAIYNALTIDGTTEMGEIRTCRPPSQPPVSTVR